MSVPDEGQCQRFLQVLLAASDPCGLLDRGAPAGIYDQASAAGAVAMASGADVHVLHAVLAAALARLDADAIVEGVLLERVATAARRWSDERAARSG